MLICRVFQPKVRAQGVSLMKPMRLSPWLILALAVMLVVVAGCDRPDPQVQLSTPVPEPQAPLAADTPTTDVAATPTLPAVIVTLDLGAATPGAPVAPQPQATPGELVPTRESPQPTPQPTTPSQATTSTNPGTHTVKTGETLFSIGRLYNVNPYAIAAANNIPYPYIIYPGQQLIIPSSSTTPGPTPIPPPSGSTPIPPPSGQCRHYHTVRPGENLYRISLAYGVPMSTIAAANGIANYNLIYAGQTLCIP
jgi:LysM repeat protein